MINEYMGVAPSTFQVVYKVSCIPGGDRLMSSFHQQYHSQTAWFSTPAFGLCGNGGGSVILEEAIERHPLDPFGDLHLLSNTGILPHLTYLYKPIREACRLMRRFWSQISIRYIVTVH